jgi:YVTN family beta-propeller protein
MSDGSARTDLPEQVPVQRAELRTFLITDIRGYTSFTAERGDEAAAKLAGKFARVAREVVKAREGIVLELRGDEAVCAFVSPRQALLAAIDFQDRLVEETVADPSLPLPAGIGLDAGEVVPIEGGYRGGALNLAARLCGIAKAGEILASPEVVHLAGKLDSITYVGRGATALKGIAVPVQVMKVVSDAQDHVAQLAPYAPRPFRPTRGHGPRWLPPALAGRRAIALAVAVVLVAVAVPLAISKMGEKGLEALAANSIGVIDPDNGRITSQIAVGLNPAQIAADGNATWVTNEVDNSVSKIDPRTNVELDHTDVGTSPSGIAVGFGAVWVANSLDGTVSRIDPQNDKVVDTFRVGNGPDGIAVGPDAIWVANLLDGAIVKINPARDRVVKTVSVGAGPTDLAVGAGAVWVALYQRNAVAKVDLATELVLPTIAVGNGPNAIDFGESGVWVANSLDDTVSRIAPASSTVIATVQVGSGPNGVAVGSEDVWVTDEYGQSVERIDPSTAAVAQRVVIGNRPEGIALGPSGLYVSVREGGEGHLGGVVTADEPFSIGLDPGKEWAGWAQEYVADGLVAFKKTDGIENELLVPDLATSLPQPTDAGTTYTFELRRGIRYSNGALLRPEDVPYTIERMFRLSSSLLTSGGFLSQIEGARSCLAHSEGCTLSSGIEANEQSYTVTFHLTHPDAAFLYQLALVYLVPTGTPLVPLEGPRFAPGTGPYMIGSYRVGKHDQATVLRLPRNPHFHEWSKAARPNGYPEEIVGLFQSSANQFDAQVDTRAVRAVEKGAADFAPVGGFFPYDPALFQEVNTRFSSLVHRYPQPGTVSLVLDPSRPPFDDIRARKALSYALDRDQIGRLTGSEPWCQFLPSGIPGYEPYCPYTVAGATIGGTSYHGPDLPKAADLVRRSRTRGQSVIVAWTNNGFPIPEVGEYVVSVLNDLGYRARLIWVPPTFQGVSRGNVMGAVGYAYDYPLASEFVPGIAGCSSGYLGSACDASLGQDMVRAKQLENSDLAAGNRLWARIDRRIVDHALLVPIYRYTFTLIVSSRVHNFQSGNGAVLKDQFWVN